MRLPWVKAEPLRTFVGPNSLANHLLFVGFHVKVEASLDVAPQKPKPAVGEGMVKRDVQPGVSGDDFAFLQRSVALTRCIGGDVGDFHGDAAVNGDHAGMKIRRISFGVGGGLHAEVAGW